MTLIKAKMLPTSSELTQRLINARVPTVQTGVNDAITKPKTNIQEFPTPFEKIAGKLQPMAPLIQAKIRVVASCNFNTLEQNGRRTHKAMR